MAADVPIGQAQAHDQVAEAVEEHHEGHAEAAEGIHEVRGEHEDRGGTPNQREGMAT